MDVFSPSWFEDVLEMEDPSSFLMDQCGVMDAFDENLMTATIGGDFQISASPENSNSSCSALSQICSPGIEPPPPPPPHPQNIGLTERAKKHRKSNNNNHFDHQSSSTPIILDFGNKSSKPGKPSPTVRATNPEDEVAKAAPGKKRVRPPSQTYDHIMAERKRREQLSQRFVALSAIVPGLKKMDKTSVLGDAIKYLKQLQEKVKTLEEQTTKQTMESVVLVTKSQLLIEDEGSSDENNGNNKNNSNDHLPEIEARFSDKSVLIRIHCEKRKGVLVKIISEVEKMNLTIMNTNASAFGTLALDVTIVAEMEEGFNMTLEDIVRSLRSAVRRHTRI